MLYISRSYADGANIWETLEPSMYFILTTPNGWEGVQQDCMRRAAIKGGLVDQNGGRRIKFVTEAEVMCFILSALPVDSLSARLRSCTLLIPAMSMIGCRYDEHFSFYRLGLIAL